MKNEAVVDSTDDDDMDEEMSYEIFFGLTQFFIATEMSNDLP